MMTRNLQQNFQKRNFSFKLKEESGLGTLEIVLIIAVLVGVALLFRREIEQFANNLIKKVFDDSVINSIQY